LTAARVRHSLALEHEAPRAEGGIQRVCSFLDGVAMKRIEVLHGMYPEWEMESEAVRGANGGDAVQGAQSSSSMRRGLDEWEGDVEGGSVLVRGVLACAELMAWASVLTVVGRAVVFGRTGLAR
jgi:hypothetical protein